MILVLQHIFYKSYYNVSLIVSKLVLTRRRRLSNRSLEFIIVIGIRKQIRLTIDLNLKKTFMLRL